MGVSASSACASPLLQAWSSWLTSSTFVSCLYAFLSLSSRPAILRLQEMGVNSMTFPRRSSMRRAALTLIVAVLLAATGAAKAHAQRFVYVVTSNQQFGTVDLDTGSFSQIGPNTPEGQANLVWGPDGSLFSLTYSGNLETINPVTGVTTVVGQTGLYFNAFDLAGVRGRLYATDFANNIYSVDPTTGAATMIRATGIPPDPAIPFTVNSDGTINLCDESLYGIAGRLFATFDAFTLDPSTLEKTPVVAPAVYE